MNPDGTERLAKVLAARGVASRREAEAWIEAGRVTVNGEVVTHPGHPVDPDGESVRVDGKKLPPAPRLVYVLLYKPRGYIVSRDDPKGRKSAVSLVANLPERVEAVGRLDYNTEGALLLTNDGDLAHRLAHPSSGVPKRYLAKVYRCPSERTLERIQTGVLLDDGKTGPCKARVVKSTDTGNTWVEITVTEGRNRLVRRLFAAVGHPVAKLRRESFATLSIRGMQPGESRELTREEVARLHDVAKGVPAAAAGRRGRARGAGFAKADPKWIAKRVAKKGSRRPARPAGRGENE